MKRIYFKHESFSLILDVLVKWIWSMLWIIFVVASGISLFPAQLIGQSETSGSPERLPSDPYEGLELENDIVGLVLWGPPTQPTLSLGRSDIWDRRWFGDRQPLITMGKIKELAMSDRLSELAPSPNQTMYNVYGNYDFPCPKPGAQLIIGTPFAESVRTRGLPNGSIQMTAEGNGKKLEATIWVSLSRSLVAISCRSEGLGANDFWVRIYRHRDTILPGQKVSRSLGLEKTGGKDFERLPAPRAFSKKEGFGIIQDFFPEMTFSEGFSAAIAARVLGAEPDITCRENEQGLGTPMVVEKFDRFYEFFTNVVKRFTPVINESPGAAATASFSKVPESFTVIAAIATTHDGPDAASEVLRMLKEGQALGYDGLLSEQEETARRMMRKNPARIIIDGKVRQEAKQTFQQSLSSPVVFPKLRRPDGYYSDIPLCTVHNTKFWLLDVGMWHNDDHFNEISAEAMLTLGLFPELLPYCEMIYNLLTQVEENAKDVYGLPGVMYPLVHFPLRSRGVTHTNLTWEQDMGLNGLVSKPLWLYYRYTGDKEFLRTMAYPVMRACARFCRAYVSEESDGYLHIFPTVSPEHWGLTARFERNRDCLSALTLTRYLFRASAEAARILSVDEAEAADWKAAAERLAPFPTYQAEDGLIWVDVAGAPPIKYNIPVPLSAVFWGDDVGLDSDPETLVLARRTLEHIKKQGEMRYPNICPRLGIYVRESGIGPDNCLLSYQSIHIFPAVPPDVEIVMENLAAQGGFRVSAVRTKEDIIKDVTILSTLGWQCRMANPWPGKAVTVVDEQGKQVMKSSEQEPFIMFATEKGKRYFLRPSL